MTKNKYIIKHLNEETKTNKYHCPQVQSRSRIHEGSPNGTRKTMEEMICEVKQMSFKSEVKCQGSDRLLECRWWQWWGDVRRCISKSMVVYI